MIYIGIDPGQNGGIAALTPEIGGTIAEAYKYSNDRLIAVIKAHEGKVRATVEKVSARPHQGVVSMFSFGANYGAIIGILEALEVEYKTVTPQKWKRAMQVTKDKQSSIDKAKELYRGINLRATDRCRTDHDGMAEALLIATYGVQLWR